MRIQLWSYNYDPEPTGIGPVSRVWAHAMQDRGHEIQVIAAHPHYPEPHWGRKLLPYHEHRDSIPVFRLPLWIGRTSARERYRQELSFTLAQTLALPALPRSDILVSVSPSFPALLPAMANARLQRIPWIIWLQDILPDGAVATGLLDQGAVMQAARRFERAAYRGATKIVVPSKSFAKNLSLKGVPQHKVELIYNPATRSPGANASRRNGSDALRILSMGNIGRSQGLAELVRVFETDTSLGHARLVIAGTGIAADEVRNEIRSDRVEMLGLVDDARLEHELANANVALVSQRYGGSEFNIPSKLMNFMTYGLPVLTVAPPESEAARITREAQAGWVIDSESAAHCLTLLRHIARDPSQLKVRGAAAREFAQRHFHPSTLGAKFNAIICETAR